MTLSPDTLRDLEQACAELFARYRRGKAYAKRLDDEMHEHSSLSDAHEKLRKFRDRVRCKANEYRRHGEAILVVLDWAKPSKQRERRLRYGRPDDLLTVDYRKEQPLIAP